MGSGRDEVDEPVVFRAADAAQEAAPEPAPDGLPVSLLVWTTTPWTLPSNIALAVAAESGGTGQPTLSR